VDQRSDGQALTFMADQQQLRLRLLQLAVALWGVGLILVPKSFETLASSSSPTSLPPPRPQQLLQQGLLQQGRWRRRHRKRTLSASSSIPDRLPLTSGKQCPSTPWCYTRCPRLAAGLGRKIQVLSVSNYKWYWRIRGGRSSHASPWDVENVTRTSHPLAKASFLNMSTVYQVHSWQSESWDIGYKAIRTLRRSQRGDVLPQVQVAIGCKATTHPPKMIINGTMLQRELFKILIKMHLGYQCCMDEMEITPANYSTLQYHPFVKFFDVPKTGVHCIERTSKMMMQRHTGYIQVDHENILYGNKKRVFVVSYDNERRAALERVYNPCISMYLKNDLYRWSYARAAFVSVQEPKSEDEIQNPSGLYENGRGSKGNYRTGYNYAKSKRFPRDYRRNDASRHKRGRRPRGRSVSRSRRRSGWIHDRESFRRQR